MPREHLTNRDARLNQFTLGELEDGRKAIADALATCDHPIRRTVLTGVLETLNSVHAEVTEELQKDTPDA